MNFSDVVSSINALHKSNTRWSPSLSDSVLRFFWNRKLKERLIDIPDEATLAAQFQTNTVKMQSVLYDLESLGLISPPDRRGKRTLLMKLPEEEAR
jgi:hypothetical protein